MDERPLLTCPRCGNEGHFHHATIENRNSGAILLFGGLWAYLLSRPSGDMYICDRCHYVFEPDPRINKWVALVIAVLCFCLAIGIAIMVLGGH